ncbi:hypothetical protein [Streptomyces dysideae]|nr:hypothetical protein [Streptomyces dysideae]
MQTKRAGRCRLNGSSTRFTWVGRSLAAATGVVLAGALIAPASVALSSDGEGNHKCNPSRKISAEVDSPTEFRVTNDRRGDAFLNDGRTPGVWVDLDVVPGTPSCVIDSAVGYSEGPSVLHLTLLAKGGVAYEAECAVTGTPFSASNLAAACGDGFTPVPGTPVP